MRVLRWNDGTPWGDPGDTDTTPFPTALTRWSYRAIYIVNDRQVGLWSAVMSVTVPAA